MSSSRCERRAIISGVGQSAIGRRLFRDDLDLTCEAALEAIADAGLQSGRHRRHRRLSRARSRAGRVSPARAIYDVQDALGIDLRWHLSGARGSGADLADHPRDAGGRPPACAGTRWSIAP